MSSESTDRAKCPSNVKFVDGDLLEAKEQYIAHQCNCVTNASKHLASSVFERFKHADVYTMRTQRSTPGTILLRGDGSDKERYVIAMFAQFYPGASRFPTNDSPTHRKNWFARCLECIGKELPGMKSLAFPHGIGCGAAGGNWVEYQQLLFNFANKVPNVNIVIYKKAS